jgi:hypothetical protein
MNLFQCLKMSMVMRFEAINCISEPGPQEPCREFFEATCIVKED